MIILDYYHNFTNLDLFNVLFIILSPFFLLNRLLDTITSMFKNNSSEVTTETEES